MPLHPTIQNLGVLVKPVSARCNLACTYCFYHERDTDPYADRPVHRMSDEVLDRFLIEYLPLAGVRPTLGWQGGEPLLAGLRFFERMIELQERLRDPSQTISHAIQTNGTLIDDDWAMFFHDHRMLIGLSIDGPADLHDAYRLDAAGRGTHARLMEVADTLRKHSAEVNILCTVNRATARKPEAVFRYLVQQGFQWLQFIPVVERLSNGQPAEFSVTPAQYGEFLKRIFDLWWNDGNPEVSVRLFDEVVSAAMGNPPMMCQLREACGGVYVVVEHNGDVYPCDFFVEERWRMGNLTETPLANLVTGSVLREFAEIKPRATSACDSCPYLPLCQRGCPHYRAVGAGFLDRDYLCEGYKRFYAHALPKIAARFGRTR